MDKPLENTKSIPLQMDTGNNNLFITHNPRRHLQRLLHASPAGGWLASLAPLSADGRGGRPHMA